MAGGVRGVIRPIFVSLALVASVSTFAEPAGASSSSMIFLPVLAGISCTSADKCTAVGSYETMGGPASDLTLTETWNGTEWRYVPSPTPPNKGGGAELLGVSCPTLSSCVAVGARLTFHVPSGITTLEPLSEVWNGTAWTLAPVPRPQNDFGLLDAVSCASPTSCVAVGSDGPKMSIGRFTLAEKWNGSMWRIVPTPALTVKGAKALDGVACTSASSCLSVGYDSDYPEPGQQRSVAELWNGKAWIRLATPHNQGAFAGVNCTGAAACTAVGERYGGIRGTVALAETWNGTSWAVARTPNPRGAGEVNLDAVSCNALTSCMATGAWLDRSGENQSTLAEQWNGTSWAIVPTPNPGSFEDQLFSVACTSSTSCMAVGDYQGIGNQFTLGEAWNGKAWKLVKTQNGP